MPIYLSPRNAPRRSLDRTRTVVVEDDVESELLEPGREAYDDVGYEAEQHKIGRFGPHNTANGQTQCDVP